MSALTIDGKEYVNLSIASERTGYERLYIRRLASARKIDAVQVDTTWLVYVPSIDDYRKAGGNRTPQKKGKRVKHGAT